MDDKTKAHWNSVMGETELKTTVLGEGERNNPELWQPTTLNKVTAQYGAAW